MSGKIGEVAATGSPIGIIVAADRMTARLSVAATVDRGLLTRAALVAALAQARVAVTPDVEARMAAFLEAVTTAPRIPADFLINAGRPARDGQDEQFSWDPGVISQAAAWQGDAAVNYYELHSVATVDVGAALGRIVPRVPAEVGVDVFGVALPPRKEAASMELDKSVGLDPAEAGLVRALVAGRPVLRGHKLLIEEILAVPGDVDLSVGSVRSTTDVQIQGTVRDGLTVESSRSVTVGGAVEAARVRAGGRVTVRGGIVCRTNGSVRAGEDVVARFGDEAEISAGGNIKIARELMNCRVFTQGRLVLEHGRVIGGAIYARDGAVLTTLGNEANVRTRLACGVHPEILQRAARIADDMKAKREAVERIRTLVKPLMANIKRLSPAQKEQATELLYKADEAEAAMASAERERARLLAEGAPRGTLQIQVQKVVCPGVIISFGARATTFQKELKGPVAIEERQVNNATELVAVSALTGSVTVLPNSKLPLTDLLKDLLPPPEVAGTETPPGDASANPSMT